jgi:hypothetical protein
MAMFTRYLMATAVVGGGVGLAHGVAAFPPNVPNRGIRIYEHALTGAILGPWLPIVSPIYVTGWWPHGKDCPWLRRTPKTPMDVLTVAEKP